MKKLAILGSRGIPARYGGFETFVEQLAKRLAKRGVDVTVICPTDSPRPDENWEGVRLKYVQFPRLGKYSEMVWDGRCFCEARSGFDIVYMLGLGGAYAAWVPRAYGTKVWVNTDGVEWKRTKFNWAQRSYLALAEALSVLFADRIIADSAAIRDYLQDRFFKPGHISTIAYGADIPFQHPDPSVVGQFGLEPDRYYIVVCRLESENHVREILQGYTDSGVKTPLVILGNTDNPNTYVRSLLEFRGPQVRFLGTVYDKSKLEALRIGSRAYLHGHSVGGTNPSLLEAMACSNLVIAHDNPFNRDVLGNEGLFFSSPTDLATILNRVEDGTVEIEYFRAHNLSRVRNYYQWDQIALAYLDLIQASK